MNSFDIYTASSAVDAQLQGTQYTQDDLVDTYTFDDAMFSPIWMLYPITDSPSSSSLDSPLLSGSLSPSFSNYEYDPTSGAYSCASSSHGSPTSSVHSSLDLTGASPGSLHSAPSLPPQGDNILFSPSTQEPWQSSEPFPASSPLPGTPEPLAVHPASPSPSCSSISVPPESPCSEWDEDAEGEPDSDYDPEAATSDDDDNYTPSSSSALRFTRKTRRTTFSRTPAARSPKSSRRFSPYSSSSSRSRASSETSSSSSDSDSSAETVALRYISARCEQVSAPLEALPKLLRSGNDMVCPICSYVQLSDRRSEFNRHVKTHFRDAAHAEHACWGVRVEEAASYGITDLSDAQMLNGELRVGGCWKGFSRRDAVLRHLKNKNNRCVCDVLPDKVCKSPPN